MKVFESGRFLYLGESVEITEVTFLLGRGTLLVGDSKGRVRTWFITRIPDANTPDGFALVNPSEFQGPSPVSSIATSSRKRLIAVGYEDGSVSTFYVTSERHLDTVQAVEQKKIEQIIFAPKDDGIAFLSDGLFGMVSFETSHPEASFRSFFRKVWYEGNPKPEHNWQSSSATDAFEPKYGLIPLIFGTLKATFYSMLFGVPIAIMGAIYTSEFLKPSLRRRIKPAVEMMASLPSVVLGFLAGLVFAPFVENVVPTVLVSFVVVPISFVLAGYLYQLLPRKMGIILSRFQFLLAALVVLPLGILASIFAGPAVERILFGGDIKLWLDGQVGDGSAGWIIMFLPGSAILVFLVVIRKLGEQMRVRYRTMKQFNVAVLELLKFLAGAVLTVAVAVLLARLLVALGLDSRQPLPVLGRLVGTYIQRNSLIVGFVMGFAVIPIIFTISDDALTAVPDHLRSASLSTGATKWQTTIRIVIPTAMSGLFSAVMIGLGRAVGETMIVLMATGNTPVMEWNIFNGFRTLAANIAV
jgi:phosphate transport system permease protein